MCVRVYSVAEVIKRLVDPATGEPLARSKATAQMTKMKSEIAMPGAGENAPLYAVCRGLSRSIAH